MNFLNFRIFLFSNFRILEFSDFLGILEFLANLPMTSQEGSRVVEDLRVLESDDADDGRQLRLVDDLPRPEFRGRGRSARIRHFDSCKKKLKHLKSGVP